MHINERTKRIFKNTMIKGDTCLCYSISFKKLSSSFFVWYINKFSPEDFINNSLKVWFIYKPNYKLVVHIHIRIRDVYVKCFYDKLKKNDKL